MISAKEVKVLDINSEFYGVTAINLMENAGKGVADFIINDLKCKNKNILFFCGMGNNGGDGLVAARYLDKKCNVTVFLVGDKIKTDISQKNFNRLKKLDIKIQYDIKKLDELLGKNDVIVDSMLGIGLSGELREPFLTIVKKINNLEDKTIISIDVPTGLNTNLAIIPDYTITFHDVKKSMNKNNCGEIKIVDIGIPDEAINYVGPGELSIYYNRPKKKSHKGDNGYVLVIGGGPYVGAPALSGMAAQKTGSDLVFIATPKRCWKIIASYSPDLVVKDLKSDILTSEDIPIIKELVNKCNSVIIGPGLGVSKETEEAINKIIKLVIEKGKPLVIDADAIKPAGKNLDLIKNSKTVVTPHVREFKKFTGVDLSEDLDRRINAVSSWAKKLNITIFLKSSVDILSNGKDTKLNKIHNEAMAVGGTGDVLAGIIGALLGKCIEPFEAIRIAAFLNGQAGNNAFEKKSYGMVGYDLIEEISNVLKKYL